MFIHFKTNVSKKNIFFLNQLDGVVVKKINNWDKYKFVHKIKQTK